MGIEELKAEYMTCQEENLRRERETYQAAMDAIARKVISQRRPS